MVRAAFVSTYPPLRCGIATFTHRLASATGGCEIVALQPPGQADPYPLEVHHRIRRDEPADFIQAARALETCADVVSIQHAPAIWGGEGGDHVLAFVRALRLPAAVTLHVVPAQPTDVERATLTELVSGTAATVVMSQAAARLLATVYGVDPGKVEVIPHGIPDLPNVEAATMKPALEVAGRTLILGFGLLGPEKGHASVIDALPAIVARHPSALYAIVGATEPDLLEREGEAWRASLQAQVARLGLESHVKFIDRFVGRVEMTRWLEAADVVVTPYKDLDQTVSGTLSYAMGAGRAVVSTPFAYAVELLAEDRGVLVASDAPAALAEGINRLLDDPALRAEIGRRAHAYSRVMTWSSVGAAYRGLFARLVAAPPVPPRRTQPVAARS